MRVHVAEAGDGPPIVLLHGWPQHRYEWRRVVPELSRTHRVIMPDLRGLGWSSVPDGPYDKETLVDDLLDLLDAEWLDEVDLVGHDWGGWVGFLAGLRAPERFRSLTALGIVHPWPPSSVALRNAWRSPTR